MDVRTSTTNEQTGISDTKVGGNVHRTSGSSEFFRFLHGFLLCTFTDTMELIRCEAEQFVHIGRRSIDHDRAQRADGPKIGICLVHALVAMLIRGDLIVKKDVVETLIRVARNNMMEAAGIVYIGQCNTMTMEESVGIHAAIMNHLDDLVTFKETFDLLNDSRVGYSSNVDEEDSQGRKANGDEFHGSDTT
jgi:hypothetical protein